MEALSAVLAIFVMFLLMGYCIRNRRSLCTWLKVTPDSKPICDRKTYLKRYITKAEWDIEDANTELQSVEGK